jgi:hypothetical protein
MVDCDAPPRDLKRPAVINTNRNFYEARSEYLIKHSRVRCRMVAEATSSIGIGFATDAGGAPKKFEAR